ncbi:ORF7 peptide [Hyphantria cunea nucleopolyhedrovirus]|uniref:ORF7 peptide n=1 Tax=Hyphantria cunea nuclear polyhedrosis virus TaxID=28288 RepID=Q2NNU0_NPVHC|nr:ORF7 peptide [Hyphantria cunea nucleopolyhedrovirus]BAE72296.1 ORF7 peptide [Hyphantria cunea nucleopolyhedrovirus]
MGLCSITCFFALQKSSCVTSKIIKRWRRGEAGKDKRWYKTRGSKFENTVQLNCCDSNQLVS